MIAKKIRVCGKDSIPLIDTFHFEMCMLDKLAHVKLTTTKSKSFKNSEKQIIYNKLFKIHSPTKKDDIAKYKKFVKMDQNGFLS